MSEYEALARNVVKRTLHIKPEENVIVECWNHGLPVAKEFVYQLRAVGARPMFLFEDEETFWRSASTLPKSKVGQVGSHEWKALDEADAYVFIPGPADIAKVREVGMDRYDAMTAYNAEWYKHAERNRLRGARLGLGYVTAQRAASYGFDLNAWRAMVIDASAVDAREFVRRGRSFARAFSKRGGKVEITAPNGTRFSCTLRGATPGVEDGVVSQEDIKEDRNIANIPAGEAWVVPDESSGEGTIVFDRPIAYVGKWIRDLTLHFDGGRLREWSASEGDDLLRPQWERAKGDRDRLAYVQAGLNLAARFGFLQDLIVAGSVYIGVGDNSESDGRNKTDFYVGSSISGATLTVNGKPFVQDGALLT